MKNTKKIKKGLDNVGTIQNNIIRREVIKNGI
jgi:hypothetical protein